MVNNFETKNARIHFNYRFSLYQQKYKFLESNAGYLLLDNKERIRLYSLFSVEPNLLKEVEGQHPAQDEEQLQDEGMEARLGDMWARRNVEVGLGRRADNAAMIAEEAEEEMAMIRRAHDLVLGRLGRGVDNNEGVQVAANGVAPPARAEVVDHAAGPVAGPQAGGGVAIAPAAVVPAGGVAGVGPAVAPGEVVVRQVNQDHQYLGAAAADAMQEAARERRLRMMR